MAASLVSVGLLLAGTAAPAQDTSPQGRLLHFNKPPNTSLIPNHTDDKAATPGSAPQDSALRPAAFQAPVRDPAARATDEGQEYQVQLEPPGPLRLFRIESEKALQERMRQEVRERTPPGQVPERIIFPEEPVISRIPYAGRSFPPGNLIVEPQYLCYQRLLFEQKNSERYGWDLGPIHPLAAAAGFYWDLVTLPYHLGTAPCRYYECSAGYCLPGDPVPLLLYPPELSLTGLAAEAGTAIALFAIFP